MPTGNLPAEGKAIWEKVHDKALQGTCKKADDPEACAAKIAWKAVKGAGWYKGKDGKWQKRSSALQEFGLRIERASFDKKTQEMRWRAVASDTDEDSFGDNMTIQLFDAFDSHIKNSDLVPEEFRSDYWSGGMPYLSVSHYGHLNGDGVPGTVTNVYRDGKYLKGKGTFSNTPLGKACFDAICQDLYGEKSEADNKVRISIAFLDWGHIHKSTGYEFKRKSLGDICPECLKEMFLDEEYNGREFIDGQLIHFALTRVPVNTRTIIEQDTLEERSMTTQKEDAESIVGEELAEELEKKETGEEISKSMAVITHSDTEEDVVVEEAVTKKEKDCSHPSSHYLVVEDSEKPTTWHLRVKNCSGDLDHRLMGAAWAALHKGYRGKEYSGPDKEKAISKLKSLYKREGLDLPNEKADVEKSEVEILKDQISSLGEKIEMLTQSDPHPLDAVLSELRSAYDEIDSQDIGSDEKLKLIQEQYGKVGEKIVTLMKGEKEAEVPAPVTGSEELVAAFSEALKPLGQKLDLLTAQLAEYKTGVKPTDAPPRRSIDPATISQRLATYDPSTPVKIGEFAKRSVGLK